MRSNTSETTIEKEEINSRQKCVAHLFYYLVGRLFMPIIGNKVKQLNPLLVYRHTNWMYGNYWTCCTYMCAYKVMMAEWIQSTQSQTFALDIVGRSAQIVRV